MLDVRASPAVLIDDGSEALVKPNVLTNQLLVHEFIVALKISRCCPLHPLACCLCCERRCAIAVVKYGEMGWRRDNPLPLVSGDPK